MKHIRFKVRADRKDKDGNNPVMLVVTKNRNRNFISLDTFVDATYWDDEQERLVIQKGLRNTDAKAANEERKKNNTFLNEIEIKANKVIDKFNDEKIDWTLNQFKDSFLSRSEQANVSNYFKDHIEMLRSTNRTGNANCYERTMHMLTLYDGERRFGSRVFSEIDIHYVKSFDVFLQKRNCKGNTRKYYFKALRALYNMALQDKLASPTAYPFGKGGFKIADLEEETEKRYLPTRYLELIKNTCSLNPLNEYARNLFLLSYYCYGISFVDMACLKHSNIIGLNDGKYIVYKRQKTQHQKKVKPISIKITAEVQTLIDKLAGFQSTCDSFLIPIVTRSGYEGEQLYNHIRGRYKKYSKYLKALAKELEIETNLTSYVSRHTMAMQLQENEIPREVISQILGHNDLQTTNTYLDSLDNSIINEASKVL